MWFSLNTSFTSFSSPNDRCHPTRHQPRKDQSQTPPIDVPAPSTDAPPPLTCHPPTDVPRTAARRMANDFTFCCQISCSVVGQELKIHAKIRQLIGAHFHPVKSCLVLFPYPCSKNTFECYLGKVALAANTSPIHFSGTGRSHKGHKRVNQAGNGTG